MNTAYKFLKSLAENNNREWFNEHKAEYRLALEEFTSFVQALINDIEKFDARIRGLDAKDCIYRIYRDARFCKDKPPYKDNFGAFIAMGGRKSVYSGYYFHFQPGSAFAGGGLWHPSKEILDAVRTKIYNNPEEFLRIIHNPQFKKVFGNIEGRKLKKAPRGFEAGFPYIDLLKFKDYTVSATLPDRILLSSSLKIKVLEIFRTMYEFNRFLNEAIDDFLS